MLKSACPSEPIPLSAEQESYLGLGRGGHDAVPICFRIQGELDLPALRRALGEVLTRHEPLRMRLVDTPDGPRQVFVPLEEADCHVRETTAVDTSAAWEMACELADERTDLRTHGPVTIWLIRSGPADAMLLVLIDHLASDVWSIGVFIKELWVGYAADVTAAGPQRFPAVPRYTDYVAAQRAAAWKPVQRDYWQRVVRDYCTPADPPPPSAPSAPSALSALSGPPDQPGRFDLVTVLDTGQRDRLVAFARAVRVPPRTVELAGLLLAIWGWWPTPVTSVWYAHSGRESKAIANAIGPYYRSVPIVVPVSPAATLAEFTRDVVTRWSEAIGHAGMPYSTAGMREMIAQARGAGPAMPEVLLNQLTSAIGTSMHAPVPVGESTQVAYCDLTSARYRWYCEPRLRIMSTFDETLSVRAVFNPGVLPAGFPEALTTRLSAMLPLFVAEHADRPVGELV